MDEILKINMQVFARLLLVYDNMRVDDQIIVDHLCREVVDPQSTSNDRETALEHLVKLLLH